MQWSIELSEGPMSAEDIAIYHERQTRALMVFYKNVFPQIAKEVLAEYKECKEGLTVTVMIDVDLENVTRDTKYVITFHKSEEMDPFFLKVAGKKETPVLAERYFSTIIMFPGLVVFPKLRLQTKMTSPPGRTCLSVS